MFASSSGVLSVVPGGHGARAMVLATDCTQIVSHSRSVSSSFTLLVYLDIWLCTF